MDNKLLREECADYNEIVDLVQRLYDLTDKGVRAISIRDAIFAKFTLKYSEPMTRYKKLEQDFGCSLELIAKLSKQEEINIEGKMVKKWYTFYNLSTNRYELRDEDTMELYPLSDYGKKFWLKKDKSE